MTDPTTPNPADFGFFPADFGADEIRCTPDGDGYHWTAYNKEDGGQISWNTDREGNYREFSPSGRFGPKVHMSDRNIKEGSGPPNVWVEEEQDFADPDSTE